MFYETQCSPCGGSVNKHGCRRATGPPSATDTCVALKYFVWVLRKTEKLDSDGTCQYSVDLQELQNGCTCVQMTSSSGPVR